VRRCLRDHTFSRFSRTLTCDRRMDGRKDRHTRRQLIRRQLVPALVSVTRVKSKKNIGNVLCTDFNDNVMKMLQGNITQSGELHRIVHIVDSGLS